MTPSKKILIISILFIIGLLSIDITAQESNKKDWKSKAKSIIGEPESVTVVTDEGTYIFDKEEAKDLVKYLKAEDKMFKYVTTHGNKDNNVMIFSNDDKIKNHHLVKIEELIDSNDSTVFLVKKGIHDVDLEWIAEGNKFEKMVEIREEDGVKIVEITSEKDGEEIVKVYSGADADEYIKEHIGDDIDKNVKKKFITVDIDTDDSEHHTVWVTDSLEEDGVTSKEIEVEIKDGKKKITITKTKDGEEIVEVLEGEEAEEYMEKYGDHKIARHIIQGIGDKNVMIFHNKGNNVHLKSDAKWNMIHEELDDEGKSIQKKIDVDIEDGVKKITVTTIKDGDETVEVFKGDEADKYLKEHNKGKSMMFISEDGDISNYDGKKIKVKKIGDDDEIEIKVEFEDDAKVEKKIKVKKIK